MVCLLLWEWRGMSASLADTLARLPPPLLLYAPPAASLAAARRRRVVATIGRLLFCLVSVGTAIAASCQTGGAVASALLELIAAPEVSATVVVFVVAAFARFQTKFGLVVSWAIVSSIVVWQMLVGALVLDLYISSVVPLSERVSVTERELTSLGLVDCEPTEAFYCQFRTLMLAVSTVGRHFQVRADFGRLTTANICAAFSFTVSR